VLPDPKRRFRARKRRSYLSRETKGFNSLSADPNNAGGMWLQWAQGTTSLEGAGEADAPPSADEGMMVGTVTGKGNGEGKMHVKRSTNAPMHPALQNRPNNDEAALAFGAPPLPVETLLAAVVDRAPRLRPPVVLTLSRSSLFSSAEPSLALWVDETTCASLMESLRLRFAPAPAEADGGALPPWAGRDDDAALGVPGAAAAADPVVAAAVVDERFAPPRHINGIAADFSPHCEHCMASNTLAS